MSRRPPDHIGWDLIEAARLWEKQFTDRMVACGHNWFGEARGKMIQYIGPDGAPQSRVVERSGLTKQAVQQHLDELERDGILTRQPDPSDTRKRIIRYTVKGKAALEDIHRIKFEIERDFVHAFGREDLDQLKQSVKSFLTFSQET